MFRGEEWDGMGAGTGKKKKGGKQGWELLTSSIPREKGCCCDIVRSVFLMEGAD